MTKNKNTNSETNVELQNFGIKPTWLSVQYATSNTQAKQLQVFLKRLAGHRHVCRAWFKNENHHQQDDEATLVHLLYNE